MKNRTLLETIKEGLPKEEVEQALKNKKAVRSVASVITAALAIEPIFLSFEPAELVLGALYSAINGLAVAKFSKEDLLKLVDTQYDEAVEKINKYMDELASAPDEDTYLTKKSKDVKFNPNELTILPTDGKVH